MYFAQIYCGGAASQCTHSLYCHYSGRVPVFFHRKYVAELVSISAALFAQQVPAARRARSDKKLLWAREPDCFAYFNFSIHVWYLNTRVWYIYCNHDFLR